MLEAHDQRAPFVGVDASGSPSFRISGRGMNLPDRDLQRQAAPPPIGLFLRQRMDLLQHGLAVAPDTRSRAFAADQFVADRTTRVIAGPRAGRKASHAAPSINVMPDAPPQSSFSPKNPHPIATAITGEIKA